MSKNTNTLFLIITGAVIILGVFGIVKNTEKKSLNKIDSKYSNMFSEVAGNEELAKYYGHEDNYALLRVTKESDFEFDKSTGTIIAYNGTNPNVVFPAFIDGVEVKKIGYLELWNKSLYYDECLRVMNSTSDEDYIEHRKEMLEYEGVLKDGVCQKRILLDSVVIPNTVEELEDCAFCYNQNIKKITLPSSIKRMGMQVFQDNQITSLNISHLNKLTYIGSGAFANNKIKGEIIIPNSVREVEWFAFAYNDVDSVILSKNLKQVSYGIFYENNNINSIEFLGKKVSMTHSHLENFGTNDFVIYVPKGSKSWYKNFSSFHSHQVIERDN